MPRKPGGARHGYRFGSLMLNVASLLPNSEVTGLGDGQQAVVHGAFDAMMPIARAALLQPLSRLTPGMVDLLRSLAKGTEERNAESGPADSALGRVGRTTETVFSPSTVRTHRYVNYADVQDFVGGLTNAEQFYETCYAATSGCSTSSPQSTGMWWTRRCRLSRAPWWRGRPSCLTCVCAAVWKWPRPGADLGQRAPFGLESTAVVC